VGVTDQGLQQQLRQLTELRVRAGDFFAQVVRSRPKVLVSGFSDGRVQCTIGAKDAGVPRYKCTGGRLIPGCSHYALDVQCTLHKQGGECPGAEVKVH
jgi:hypothetical protein